MLNLCNKLITIFHEKWPSVSGGFYNSPFGKHKNLLLELEIMEAA
jgi:hypothetical protein